MIARRAPTRRSNIVGVLFFSLRKRFHLQAQSSREVYTTAGSIYRTSTRLSLLRSVCSPQMVASKWARRSASQSQPTTRRAGSPHGASAPSSRRSSASSHQKLRARSRGSTTRTRSGGSSQHDQPPINAQCAARACPTLRSIARIARRAQLRFMYRQSFGSLQKRLRERERSHQTRQKPMRARMCPPRLPLQVAPLQAPTLQGAPLQVVSLLPPPPLLYR